MRIVERRPTAEEYDQLIDAVGWRKTQPDADAETILSAPLFSVVAEEASGKAVGCALLLGDSSSFYYVKDVMVHPAWQSKNIGTEMMKSITRWLQSNAPDNALVGLFTGGYLAPFYTQFGFRHAYGMSLRVQNKLP